MKGCPTIFASLVAAAAADNFRCPSSPAWIHAWAKVKVTAYTSCDDAMAETAARVDGQPTRWHDPHNDGHYSLISTEDNVQELTRVTGNHKYTDKQAFHYVPDGPNTCIIYGCSESQVTSVVDFSTNYCDLLMMYCGEEQGCKPVKYNYKSKEDELITSRGAGRDASSCFKDADSVAAVASDGFVCPSSPAFIHAWAEVKVTASTSCDHAMAETAARVDGQPTRWHDPHNDGKYSLISTEDNVQELTRVTGNNKYTDKQALHYVSDGPDTCIIYGCSQSQVTSVVDFSTNYCDLTMLFCGKAEGCKPVKYNYDIKIDVVTTSAGAGRDPTACLKCEEAQAVLQV